VPTTFANKPIVADNKWNSPHCVAEKIDGFKATNVTLFNSSLWDGNDTLWTTTPEVEFWRYDGILGENAPSFLLVCPKSLSSWKEFNGFSSLIPLRSFRP